MASKFLRFNLKKSKTTASASSTIQQPHISASTSKINELHDDEKKLSKFKLFRQYFKSKLNINDFKSREKLNIDDENTNIQQHQPKIVNQTRATKNRFPKNIRDFLTRNLKPQQPPQVNINTAVKTTTSVYDQDKSNDEDDDDEGLSKTPDSLASDKVRGTDRIGERMSNRTKQARTTDCTYSSVDSLGSFDSGGQELNEQQQQQLVLLNNLKPKLIDNQMSKSKIQAAKPRRNQHNYRNARTGTTTQSSQNTSLSLDQTTQIVDNSNDNSIFNELSLNQSSTHPKEYEIPNDDDKNVINETSSPANQPTALSSTPSSSSSSSSSYKNSITPKAANIDLINRELNEILSSKSPSQAILKHNTAKTNRYSLIQSNQQQQHEQPQLDAEQALMNQKRKSLNLDLEKNQSTNRERVQRESELPEWFQVAIKKQNAWEHNSAEIESILLKKGDDNDEDIVEV